jgi:hypothetical protein
VKVHPERVDQRKKHERELNVYGLCFTLNIRQVKKFENPNSSISINVFAYDGKLEFILFTSLFNKTRRTSTRKREIV